MRIKLLQVVFALAWCSPCISWSQSQIEFSDISFSAADNVWDVKPTLLQLENGKSINKVFILTSDGRVNLNVSMKISRMKSKISQHKSQGVRLVIKYRCRLDGSLSKTETQRVFWPDNDGIFKETVEFSFNKSKLKPLVGTLKFNAKVILAR